LEAPFQEIKAVNLTRTPGNFNVGEHEATDDTRHSRVASAAL